MTRTNPSNESDATMGRRWLPLSIYESEAGTDDSATYDFGRPAQGCCTSSRVSRRQSNLLQLPGVEGPSCFRAARRTGGNRLYGKRLTAGDIVRSSEVKSPAAGESLVSLLDSCAQHDVDLRVDECNRDFSPTTFRFLSYSPFIVNGSFFLITYPRVEFLGGRMSIRSLFTGLAIVALSFTLSGRAIAQGQWAVENTFHVGGDGGFDYITVDAKTHRLYVPRSTHTMVIDADSGTTVADIAGQKHNHGVALAPELGRGFISDGAGSIVIFDLKTNAILGTVAAKDDADGIIYDKGTGLVLVACGDAGVLVTLKADADPKTAAIDAPIELGGKPEFLASDEAGKVYVNLEDKDRFAVVDLNARKVLAHWPVAPGGSPVGMSIDTANTEFSSAAVNRRRCLS